MPEQSDRTKRLSIALRAVSLLIVVAGVGLIFAFTRPDGPTTAQAQSTVQAPSTAQAQSTARDAHETLEGAECAQCHKATGGEMGIVDSFALGLHGKSAKFLNDGRAATCASCHGDGKKHVESADPKDIINPATEWTVKQNNDTCLKCHSKDHYLYNWKGGEHDRADMSCLSCHSVHHAKSSERLLANFTVEDTCLRCHKEQRKALFQRSTHLFRTEQRNMKVGCASCHNPHGGEARKMLVNHTVNDTCYSCHAEKRGPFLWEHPPARENCMNCHAPHGSNNIKLLTARPHLLCQQCHIHMLPRHSTTAGRPLDIWSINRGCVSCHANVHGSNHPGGRTFGR
jgi:DmsE family decaheme c-type cytochrome